MCIQVLRTDSSKGIPFCGLDVAASKGYFCSVQPGAAWGQAPGGQGRERCGFGSRTRHTPSLLQVFMLERDAL